MLQFGPCCPKAFSFLLCCTRKIFRYMLPGCPVTAICKDALYYIRRKQRAPSVTLAEHTTFKLTTSRVAKSSAAFAAFPSALTVMSPL